jgi:nitronate monooxygenase
MAGGPATVDLAVAVSDAGGLGFLAGAYLTPDQFAANIREARQRTPGPVGANIFSPVPPAAVSEAELLTYAQRWAPEADRLGVALGTPRHDDDAFEEKVDVMCVERPAVASFSFGLPSASVIEKLHAAGVPVAVTVTSPDEAVLAERAGADAVVAQGWEGGGHRGGFRDDDGEQLGVLPLITLVTSAVDIPLIAAGGIGDGRAVAAVLAAGADAAMLGSVFLRSPEAGTSDPHRAALTQSRTTAVTRAFSGRRGRGLRNRFMNDDLVAGADAAPLAYPDLHHITSPVRAAARKAGDPEVINLWAGQAASLGTTQPAGDILRTLWTQAHEALTAAAAQVPAPPQ